MERIVPLVMLNCAPSNRPLGCGAFPPPSWGSTREFRTFACGLSMFISADGTLFTQLLPGWAAVLS